MILSTIQRRNIIAAIECALDEFYGTCPRSFIVDGLTIVGEQVRLRADGIKPKGQITVDEAGEVKIER